MNKDKVIQVRVTTKEFNDVKTLAEEMGFTSSQLVRKSLLNILQGKVKIK